jgi:molecular chaperone GrpE
MDQETQNTQKDNPDDSDIQENPENNENINAESDSEEKANEKLTQKVQDAYSQNENFQDKYIRVLADLENLKRRQIKEREEAVLRTRSQIIGDLLPTLDAFQMGMQEVEKDESTKNIFVGISMAYKQMENILGEYGLELINPVGSEFDPKYHEALSHQASEEVAEGFVIQTIRTGYKMKDKLLRPASVIISQGSKEAEQS